MSASSTRPYDKNAVTPNTEAARDGERVGAAAACARSRARSRVTDHADTPAKNASAVCHQITAGTSTMNGRRGARGVLARDLAQRDERRDAGRARRRRRRARRSSRASSSPTLSSSHSITTIPGGWPLVCCG